MRGARKHIPGGIAANTEAGPLFHSADRLAPCPIHVHPGLEHAEIILPGGWVAMIDKQDAPLVAAFPWRRHQNRAGDRPYVRARIGGRLVYLHRFIVGPADGQLVDHANRDGLDCRRSNLRICNSSRNHANSVARHHTSRFKGVSADRGRWRAEICNTFIGRFSDEEDAARAYDRMARARWGGFARLNFPNVGERSCVAQTAPILVDLEAQRREWLRDARHYARRHRRRQARARLLVAEAHSDAAPKDAAA